MAGHSRGHDISSCSGNMSTHNTVVTVPREMGMAKRLETALDKWIVFQQKARTESDMT